MTLDSESKKKLIEQAKVARMRRKRLEDGSTDAPAHKVVEKAPLETENIYRTLVENAGEGIVVAQDGMLRFANPRLADVLGCSLKELLSRPFIEFVHPDDRERVTEIHVKRFNGEQVPAAYEFRIVDKQGNMKWLENSAILIDWGGRPAAMGFLRDVTERKQAEEALSESEKRFRSLSEAAFEGIAFSENGVLVDANEAFARMYRCSLEELKGKPVVELVTPEDRELVAENIRSGYEGICEQKGLRKDGSLIDLEIRGRTVTYQGRKMRMTAIRDITERNKADQALRASEEWLKILFESAPDAYYVHDLEGKFVDANRAAEELVGYQKEEAIGKTFFKLGMVTEADVPKINAAIAENRDGKPAEPLELTLNRKDGSKVMVETRSYPVDKGGETLILGIARDITERKRADETLRESERKIRAIFDQTSQFIGLMEPDGTLIGANRTALDFCGVKESDVIGKPFWDTSWWTHSPELQNTLRDGVRRAAAGEFFRFETHHLASDGSIRYVDGSLKPVKDDTGKVVLIIPEGHDITERKQAEEALRDSENFLQNVFDGIRDGISVLDLDLNIVRVNKWMEQMYGTETPLVGRKCYEVYQKRECLCPWCPSVRTIETGEAHTEIVPYPSDENPTGWIELSAFPLKGSDSSVVGVIEHVKGITERKRAEEAVREQRDRAQKYLDVAAVMFVALDSQGDVTLVNKRGCELLGWDEPEIVGKNWFDNFLPENTKEQIKAVFLELIAGNIEPVECYENPILCRDGSQKVIAWHNTELKDGSGNIIGTLGSGQDITEHKQVEEELRTSEEKYRSIFETAPVSLVMVDKNGKIVDINPHHLANISKGKTSKEDFIGKSIIEHPSIVNAGLSEEYRKVLEGRELDKKDVYFPTLTSGMGGYFNVKGVAVVKADEVIGAVFAHEDITERKRAEDELRSLSSVVEQSTEGMAIADLNGNLIFINKAWCKMHGYKSCESPVGKNLEIFHNKKQLKNDVIPFNEEVKKNGTCTGEVGHITKDGKPFPTLMTTTLLKDARGNPFAMAGIAKDITERKRAEAKASEYQMQLKSLALQLSNTEEHEKHRLATVLHDEIGQSLVLTKLQLDQLRASEPSSELSKALEEVCNQLGQAIQQTRTLTFDLSSPILHELGFEAAVAEWLSDEVEQKHGIKAEFEDDKQAKPLDDNLRMFLFRNVRELLVNVVKHARARKVKVSLSRVEDNIHITVGDDGVGFDPIEVASMAARRAKFGLFSIHERMAHLGGSIEIASEPGRGSRILMTAPLKRMEPDNAPQTP